MKDKKGFTLIELLAVIVILGLLMAIAIPSVTKYITESRKKTVVSTIGNYITAMVNEVNDLTYTFTEANTIYAVPIECIALERGGTNPFGAWHQASNAYWAYVLVQYDDETSSYTYGYTFKDSAGYGLYPTSQSKLNEQGKQIQTGLTLALPLSGKAINVASIDNWTGFKVDSTTNVIVLMAESEGTTGDGKYTCTLQQKGNNYANVEEEKDSRPRGHLYDLIFIDNRINTNVATLTKSNNNSSDVDGLYLSNATSGGSATYFFRGNVNNNYVNFAGLIWRIIRVNEDGTIRILLSNRIDSKSYGFTTISANYTNMYYSNSDIAMPKINNWYKTNIEEKGYDSYLSSSGFCEQAKTRYFLHTSGNAQMMDYSTYIPNFTCSTDGNGKGVLDSMVGLITYDEVIHAGGYVGSINDSYYLYNGNNGMCTISSSGFYNNSARIWAIAKDGSVNRSLVTNGCGLYPVVNLKSDVFATGTGTSSDPYKIKTK